jgi:hypothetical protein
MEHRHSPRKPVNVAVQLVTNEGKTYDGQLRELSASGMRVILNTNMPDRIKVVDVVQLTSDDAPSAARRLRMFLTRKQGRVLGLCLMNERDQIDHDWCQDGQYLFAKPKLFAS